MPPLPERTSRVSGQSRPQKRLSLLSWTGQGQFSTHRTQLLSDQLTRVKFLGEVAHSLLPAKKDMACTAPFAHLRHVTDGGIGPKALLEQPAMRITLILLLSSSSPLLLCSLGVPWVLVPACLYFLSVFSPFLLPQASLTG